MNGLKVIQMSRIKHPDMAFVIVSGYKSLVFRAGELTEEYGSPVQRFVLNRDL